MKSLSEQEFGSRASRPTCDMRVILTVADLQPESGGPSRSIPALAVGLADLGVFVTVVALRYEGDAAPPSVVRHERIRTLLVPCGEPANKRIRAGGRFGRGVLDCCLAGEPVILHDNGLWLGTNHATVRVARNTGSPLVISPRGVLAPWALAFRAWRKKVAWWLYQRRDLCFARVLHATSQDEAQGLRALNLRQPIAIIPNGVEGPPTPAPQADEPRDHVIPLSRGPVVRTVLFLGRIHPIKGLLNLVAAWAAVRPQGWRVVLAGENENNHQAEVEAAIQNHHLEQDFKFVGPVDGSDKWGLYRSADLFVMPSHSENFGLAVAEALACGVPVITTKGTPWQELETNRCGWWVGLGVEMLAGALREATSLSDEQRRGMGQRGRLLIGRSYTWPAAARQMFSVYRWMLGLGDRPGCVIPCCSTADEGLTGTPKTFQAALCNVS